MNNWTISRRIIAGFTIMVLLTVALGVFALWRLMGLAQSVADIADNSLPSVVALGEIANLSRDNLISLLRINGEESAERNAQLEAEAKSAASRAAIDRRTIQQRTADSADERMRKNWAELARQLAIRSKLNVTLRRERTS